jgi:hypothetical protein
MKLKLDDAGHVVVQDGKPVYMTDDGKEVAFDAPGTAATISRLNAEAKGHRERAETAEKSLKAFEGIEDPKAAIAALTTIKNLDDKKLIDAGEVEKVKAETIKALEAQYAPTVKKAQDLEAALYAEKIGGSFARSKFIADKIAIPPDMMEAKFGSAFKIEDGKVAAYDHTGKAIYSKSRPGELADFDEALEVLVDTYPHRDGVLKGNNNGGAGSRGGTSPGGSKTIGRAAFESLDPAAKMKAISEGVKLTD